MNAKTMDFLFKKKSADVDFEKSVSGILVPAPVIFDSEILDEIIPVLYWYGDDEEGKQREFPLCVAPEFFDKKLAADSRHCDVWFVGSLTNLRNSRFKTDGYDVRCHQEDLQEETLLVCGMISGMSFIFEIVSIADPEVGIIAPKLYLKEERMSPGGVELDF